MIDFPKNINPIFIRKKLNRFLSEARKKAKPDVCILCGESQTSFCNSHSVPQFALKTIATTGEVYQASLSMGLDYNIVDIKKGVNNSGTFNYICCSCDNSFFQDYENLENLEKTPTDKMLAEIAVKNFLLQISKRSIEKELFKIQQRELNSFENPEELLDIQEVDCKEFYEEINFHKNIVDNNIQGGYQILHYELLPYVVPVALQSAFTMRMDLEGRTINNVFEPNPEIRMQYIHLCILPLREKSMVLFFYHKRDKKYRNFRHQFNSISKEKKLRVINYLMFLYTENYYISKTIKEEIDSNDKLKILCQDYNGYPNLGMVDYMGIVENYQPVTMDEIPNFLLEKWKN